MPDTATKTPQIRAYYDRANPDLLNRLPLTAKKVLELGCGAGALGAAFKGRVPGAFFAGLELDPEAAGIAAKRLDLVAVFNADTDDLPKAIIEQAPFDAVVFGDVLEHLRDPWAVVRRFADLLAPGATMLTCIPNVQNWKILHTLLTEGFRFEDEGLFDRTHLRWFGLNNMLDLMKQAGVQPSEVWPRNYITDGHEAFVKAMTPSLPSLGLNVETFAQRTLPLQYVLRGVKGEQAAQRMLVHAMMLRPVGGVNDVRIGRPMLALGSVPGVETLAEVKTIRFQQRPDGVPKIFIWQRPVHQRRDAANILKLIQNGYVVVTEFDDHTMRWPAIAENDYLTLTGCHGVQTSTQYLADIFTEQQQAAPNTIKVFQNSILSLPERNNFRTGEPLTVFFGALNREDDWAPIMPGLNKAIAALVAEGITLRFQIVHDRGFFDALATDHKSFTPTCAYHEYLTLMGACDIALMPLADNLFNRCKSDLKFIEAGAAGLAVIASPTVYQHSVEHDQTGILAEQPDDFGRALQDLARTPDKARQLGDKARDYVQANRMMATQVSARLDWYRELWDTRAQTTPVLVQHLQSVLAKAEPDDPDRL